jgi:hypothetical protein
MVTTMRCVAALLVLLAACEPPPPPSAPDDDDASDYELPPGDPADEELGDPVACDAPSAAYVDLAADAGLAFAPRFAQPSSTFALFDSYAAGYSSVEVETAGGFAVGDLDGDGHLDLVFTDYDRPVRAFRGDGALTFEPFDLPDLPEAYYRGANLIDLDGDGDLDLYLLSTDENLALRNDGAGGFVDATADWNLAAGPMASCSAAWADMDRDGDLDAWVTNYGDGPESTEAPTLPEPDVFLVQEDGVFIDASDRLPAHFGAGHGYVAGWFDADDDGLLDLLVTNDLGGTHPAAEPNHFARNLGPPDHALLPAPEAALDRPIMAMGLAIGDADGDGDLDVHVTNAGPSYFGRNDSGSAPLFTDLSLATRELSDSEAGDISWSTEFADLDNDGRLELLTAFGWMPTKGTEGGPQDSANPWQQPDRVWRLTGEGIEYADVAPDWGLASTASTRTLTTVDLDGDGVLEVLAWSLDEGPRLSRRGCSEHAWLTLHLRDQTAANSHAIGARVDVLDRGAWVLRRDLVAGSTGALGTGAPQLTIGLGEMETVDLVVTWPDGSTTVNPAVPTRREVVLTRR